MENPNYGFFFHLNSPFREGKHLGVSSQYKDHPDITEVFNTVSNIFYIFLGGWCCKMTSRNDSLMRICCALMITTGITSSLYHSTLWMGMGILDGLNMYLLIIFLSIALVEDIVCTVLKDNAAFNGVMSSIIVLYMLFVSFIIQQQTILDEW